MTEISVIPIHNEDERSMGIFKFEVTVGGDKCLISVLRKFQPKNRKEYHVVSIKVGEETVWSRCFDITKHPSTRREFVEFLSTPDLSTLPTLTTLNCGKRILQRLDNYISDEITSGFHPVTEDQILYPLC
jgi:hypothetical protein